MTLLSKTAAPTTGAVGALLAWDFRRAYPLVPDLRTDHRQQMQSRFRAGRIQRGEFMTLLFIPQILGRI